MDRPRDWFDRWAAAVARREGISLAAAERKVDAMLARGRRRVVYPPATVTPANETDGAMGARPPC